MGIFGEGFDIYVSPCSRFLPGNGTAVRFRKSLGFKVKTVFTDPECRLVVLNVDGTHVCAFRLCFVFGSVLTGLSDIFRRLELLMGKIRPFL